MTLTSGVQNRTEDLYKATSSIDCLNSDAENDLYLEVMACPYCNLAEEIENLRQEVFENEKNLELAAKYGQNLLIENSSLKSHLESLSSDNSSLLEEKEGKYHELKMQMERMKTDYESRISSVEVELMNSKGELDSKLMEIDRLNFERNSIKTELSSQRVAFAETIKQRDETEDLLNEELLSVKSRLGVLEKNLFDERKRERNALSENDTLCLRLEEYGSKMKSVLYENTGLKTQIEELKAHLEEAMQNIEYLSAQNDELSSQNNAEQAQPPNQQLYVSNEYLTVAEQNSFKSSDNKRRHSMFLSPSKASKLFDDHSEKKRPQSFAWDQDVSVENFEVNSGASGEIVWQEYEDDGGGDCDGIEDDNFIQDGCEQSLHESLAGIDDSQHCKSWLEEFSEVEEKHRRESSFSHSKSHSQEQEGEVEENCDVTRPHTSSSTVSTFDQFDQDTVERILLDIQEIGLKLKLYLSNNLKTSQAIISSTSGLKSVNSLTSTSGSSNQCRAADHEPASSSSLDGSQPYHHHEHHERKEDSSETVCSSRSEKNHYQYESIIEQLSVFTSCSAVNTQSINSGNAYETISHRLSTLLRLTSTLGDLELLQHKTDDAASQTGDVIGYERADSHDPHNVKREYAAIEQLYSHDELEKVTRERDDAMKRVADSEEKVRQLKCDLEQAIKSKAKLYDQLEEIQCADLTNSVSKVPTTSTISSLSNKSTPNGKQPTTTTTTTSTASKMQKYVKSPHLIAQNSHSNSTNTTPRNNTTTRSTKQQGSAVAKQLFGATKSSNPNMSASTKSPAGRPVSKSYASSSEFIDLDYQSGSSITGSPTGGSFQSISSASPLGRSKTLHLHELASYVSSKRYTQHGQYRLIADSEGTEGSDFNESEEKQANGGKKPTTTTTATSVPNSTSKSITRRLSLWSNR